MKIKRPIMIVAGGTGGHIYPGLALARELKERSQDVVWLGTKKGLEAELVSEANIEINWISVPRLRGLGYLAWLLSPFRLLISIIQTLVIFYKCNPSVVVGFGGFVSGPGGFVAWLTRRPLLIHEQNAIAGSSNKILAKFASEIFAAFPNSFPDKVESKIIGNPIRKSILNILSPEERFFERLEKKLVINILVLGGSQGSRALNFKIPKILKEVKRDIDLNVWHQVGKDKSSIEDIYKNYEVKAKVENFIFNIADAYKWADIVVCRAGALTISELEIVGIGAILIPLPNSIDNHQYKNAISFCSNGAGLIILENELGLKLSRKKIINLCKNKKELINLANNARKNAKRGATKILADTCIKFANRI
ncbi:MAG: undecaprenyldiphospho-muramoylpentapeptide beta-N-acetylglucosaminyltransferase [Gammaproteobacteria bacterium TMED78]|nr:MAG: undecaprenyldiphospho-muramoylpentapeptide beta-N-acetylglucosaminyltransferase [Gammaproteobacteria bacterium TMED78]|tara:strand:- start:74595 stop:75689 length:1095 start_codon:yes stop_codon:yes gene_type:complete